MRMPTGSGILSCSRDELLHNGDFFLLDKKTESIRVEDVLSLIEKSRCLTIPFFPLSVGEMNGYLEAQNVPEEDIGLAGFICGNCPYRSLSGGVIHAPVCILFTPAIQNGGRRGQDMSSRLREAGKPLYRA